MTSNNFKNIFVKKTNKNSVTISAHNTKSAMHRMETMIFVDEDHKYLKEIVENDGLYKQDVFIPYDATAYIFVKEDLVKADAHDFTVWECKNGTIELTMCVTAYSSQDTATFVSGWDAYTEWIQKMNESFCPVTKIPAAYSKVYAAV